MTEQCILTSLTLFKLQMANNTVRQSLTKLVKKSFFQKSVSFFISLKYGRNARMAQEYSMGLIFTHQISRHRNCHRTHYSFTFVIPSSLWTHYIGTKIPKQLMPTSRKWWNKVVGQWWLVEKSIFSITYNTQEQQS